MLLIEELYVAFGIASVLLLLFARKMRVYEQQPPSSDSEMDVVLQTDPTPFEVDPMDLVSDEEVDNYELKEKWY